MAHGVRSGILADIVYQQNFLKKDACIKISTENLNHKYICQKMALWFEYEPKKTKKNALHQEKLSSYYICEPLKQKLIFDVSKRPMIFLNFKLMVHEF